MKPVILIAVLFIIVFPAHAQNIIGFQAGMGASATFIKTVIPTPGCEGYYLKKVSGRLALGGALSVQKYSFSRHLGDIKTTNFSDILNLSQKSTYFFVSPKADIGIGKFQKIHVGLSCGPGIFLGGDQKSDINYTTTHPTPSPGYPPVIFYDQYQFSTKGNVSKLIFQAQAQISEHVADTKKLGVYIFQQFCFIPSYISTNKVNQYSNNSNEYFMKTNYFSCGIGFVSRNYTSKPAKTRPARAQKKHTKFAETFDY